MQTLQQQRSALGIGCSLLIGAGLMVFGVVICAGVGLRPALDLIDGKPLVASELVGPIMTAVFMAVMGIVGLFIFIGGLRPLIARARAAPPQVQVSKTTPRVGERLVLSYQQQFRAATTVKLIRLRFVLRETVTFRRGTDTVTEHYDHIVQEFEVPERRFEAGETYIDRRDLEVPRTGIHSFRSSNNVLTWQVTVQVKMAGWPDYEAVFPITVLPELQP